MTLHNKLRAHVQSLNRANLRWFERRRDGRGGIDAATVKIAPHVIERLEGHAATGRLPAATPADVMALIDVARIYASRAPKLGKYKIPMLWRDGSHQAYACATHTPRGLVVKTAHPTDMWDPRARHAELMHARDVLAAIEGIIPPPEPYAPLDASDA